MPCPHLHCPLSTSQLVSMAATPCWEQLQTSHPIRGWQPNVCGSHRTQSGRTVRGGQMHSPDMGSQSCAPHSQAEETG